MTINRITDRETGDVIDANNDDADFDNIITELNAHTAASAPHTGHLNKSGGTMTGTLTIGVGSGDALKITAGNITNDSGNLTLSSGNLSVTGTITATDNIKTATTKKIGLNAGLTSYITESATGVVDIYNNSGLGLKITAAGDIVTTVDPYNFAVPTTKKYYLSNDLDLCIYENTNLVLSVSVNDGAYDIFQLNGSTTTTTMLFQSNDSLLLDFRVGTGGDTDEDLRLRMTSRTSSQLIGELGLNDSSTPILTGGIDGSMYLATTSNFPLQLGANSIAYVTINTTGIIDIDNTGILFDGDRNTTTNTADIYFDQVNSNTGIQAAMRFDNSNYDYIFWFDDSLDLTALGSYHGRIPIRSSSGSTFYIPAYSP